MKIQRVRFHGFGQWVDRSFSFHDGINLIEAPNESGKSTLIQGIFALLYGRNKEGDYKKKQKAIWYEKFIPWEKKDQYGGEIDYTVNHEAYRLIRSFHDDDQQLVKWKTGEDITELFQMDQKKERLYLESQVGLSGEMIKRICFIHSLSFIEPFRHKDAKENALIHRLTSMMRQGEELNVYAALQHLRKQINAIGSQQGPSQTLYGQTKKKVVELEREIDQLRQLQDQIEYDEEQLNRLLQTEVDLRHELEALRRQKEWYQCWKEWDYSQFQKKALHEKLTRIRELQDKVAILQSKDRQNPLSELIASQDELDTYVQWIQKRDHVEQILQDHHRQILELKTHIEKIQKEHFLMIQFDLSQAQQMVDRLDQYKALERQANSRCNQITELQEEYQQVEKDIQELKRLTYSSPCSNRLLHVWLIISAISGVFSLIMILFNPYASAMLAIMGMGALFGRFLHKRSSMLSVKKQQRLILDRWQVQSVFDLYRKQEEIEYTLKELAHRDEQKMEAIRQQVKQWLTPFQNQLTLFDPDQWKEKLKSLMQKSKEKKKWLQSRENRVEYLNEECQRFQATLVEINEWINREKKKWKTDQISEINQLKQQITLKQNLKKELDAAEKELNQYLQQAKLEAWEEKFEKSCKKIDDTIQRSQGAFCLLSEKGYFHQEKKSIINQKEQEYLELRRKMAQLKGSLEVRYQELEALTDLEVERKKLIEQLKGFDQERELLQIALDSLEEARKQVEENIAPQLKPYVTKWISWITQGKYEECSILPDQGFTLRFFEPKTGKSIPASDLSRGTMDQMYFALRLAMLQFYSEQSEGTDLPLFLDDSFVHFDDARLRAVIHILHQFSKRHQIFLCTCQGRERKVLEEEGIPFQFIQLADSPASLIS